MSASAVEFHLSRCADCARWLAQATAAGRQLRVTGTTPSDLSEQILAGVVLPAARVGRHRRNLRVALAALGFLQWAFAVPSLLGDTTAHDGMAMGVHSAHESAAWNLALGAAFLAVAIRPVRAIGMLPMLATFVGILAILSIPDLAAGQVSAPRLASHTAVVLGLVLLRLISRTQRLPLPGGSALADAALEPTADRVHGGSGRPGRKWGAA